MRVLISGGAGFIGSQVAVQLARTGHEVTVLDNLSPQIYGSHPERSYTYRAVSGVARFHQGDVRDPAAWSELLPNQDAVLHLAAETGTGQSMYQVAHYSQVNVIGTSNLLDYLVNQPNSVSRLVVASSRSIYGEGRYECRSHGFVYPIGRGVEDLLAGVFEPRCPSCPEFVTPVATDERSMLRPASVYAVSKLTQEQLVLAVARSLGISAFALRYQNVYGPGQSLINPYTGILSIFSTAMLNAMPINIFEDGLESRDFVHVSDVAEATIKALVSDVTGQHSLNIGSGVPTTVIDVVHALAASYRVHVDYRVTGNFRAGDIRHNWADISRAREVLGFEPRVDFPTGISRFVEWVQSECDSIPAGVSYQQSLDEMRQKGLLR